MEYRQGSHTKYKIEYHFVWVTKYRYTMLVGDLAIRVRELVRQTCERYRTVNRLRSLPVLLDFQSAISNPPTSSRWLFSFSPAT